MISATGKPSESVHEFKHGQDSLVGLKSSSLNNGISSREALGETSNVPEPQMSFTLYSDRSQTTDSSASSRMDGRQASLDLSEPVQVSLGPKRRAYDSEAYSSQTELPSRKRAASQFPNIGSEESKRLRSRLHDEQLSPLSQNNNRHEDGVSHNSERKNSSSSPLALDTQHEHPPVSVATSTPLKSALLEHTRPSQLAPDQRLKPDISYFVLISSGLQEEYKSWDGGPLNRLTLDNFFIKVALYAQRENISSIRCSLSSPQAAFKRKTFHVDKDKTGIFEMMNNTFNIAVKEGLRRGITKYQLLLEPMFDEQENDKAQRVHGSNDDSDLEFDM